MQYHTEAVWEAIHFAWQGFDCRKMRGLCIHLMSAAPQALSAARVMITS